MYFYGGGLNLNCWASFVQTKRAFILGAGFSKQVDMPLATELTGLILERFKEYKQDEMLDWFDWLANRIKWLTAGRESGGINIEQVFDLALSDVELFKMNQHLCPLGRTAGNTPWQTAEDIGAWLSYMEDDLRDVIWERQKNAREKLSLIERFSQNLRQNDVVLSFNYDTLLEESLTEIGKLWRYGFAREDGGGLPVLKMHGSINWAVVRRDQAQNFGYPVLFQKEDKNRECENANATGEEEYDTVLLRIPDDKLANRIENLDLQPGHKQYAIGIAGLGSYKPLHQIPGSGEVWFNAIKALREAQKIYIIGFSLSPFDNMARLHFGEVMCGRAEKKNLPQKVVLIDPKASELKGNFASVFGPDVQMMLRQQKGEEVQWAELMAP
jgi:hypothetical protein